MERKITLVLSVLTIMTLVIAQIQVVEGAACCPEKKVVCYVHCFVDDKRPLDVCVEECNCQIVPEGSPCPPPPPPPPEPLTGVCCPDSFSKFSYIACIVNGGGNRSSCIRWAGCILKSEETCPAENPYESFTNTGDAVNEDCKLGCVTSACGALTTLQNSDASEIVNGALEKCTKTCSALCTKGSLAASK